MVFCRLVQPSTMSDLSEVALPTRFIFLALSPEDDGPNVIWELSEMGRSLGSMLGDQVRRNIPAFKKPKQVSFIGFWLFPVKVGLFIKCPT